jgi:hypothetical protein
MWRREQLSGHHLFPGEDFCGSNNRVLIFLCLLGSLPASSENLATATFIHICRGNAFFQLLGADLDGLPGKIEWQTKLLVEDFD